MRNKNVPRQQNYFDCGVHVLQLCENVLKQFKNEEVLKINFLNIVSQDEIKKKRKMIVDIAIGLNTKSQGARIEA